MKFGSLFSGIEAASVAWKPLGWSCAFVAEIEPFPCAVLAHHYPDVPNFGDVTRFKEWPDAALDVLVGGSPCQSFSVAGLRKGMADPRGNLTLTYLAVVDRYRPRWVVWENVPGVLSIDGGRVFGAFLGALGQLGYGFAYRVLDAQFFGVPQRRRRVFVVGHLGDWRRAAAVLFDSASLSGNPPPRRKTGEGIAPTLSARPSGGGGLGTDFDCDGKVVAAAVTSKWAKGTGGLAEDEAQNLVVHSLRGDGHDDSEDGTGRGVPLAAFDARQSHVVQYGDKSGSLDTDPYSIAVHGAFGCRRITPRECERLQGFPEIFHRMVINICAEENREAASSAQHHSLLQNPEADEHVDVLVRIDLERQHLQLLRRGKLSWSARLAADQSLSPLAIPAEDFAQAIVRTLTTLEPITRDGVEVLLPNTQHSSRLLRGSGYVRLSGSEIRELADDAAAFTSAQTQCLKFTTSQAGQDSLTYAHHLRTWSCFVAVVISSFIHEAIQTANTFVVEVHHGYTLIPYRGKPTTDSPRYKALGNSMAVPVMRWIGQRIQMCESVSCSAEPASATWSGAARRSGERLKP